MNRYDGHAIDTLSHIRQSIGDILSTRIGSRVMRREYGSQLVDLIDSPGNQTTLLRAYAAVAMSLMRWEPRIRISRIQLSNLNISGQCELELEASLVSNDEPVNLKIPLTMGAV